MGDHERDTMLATFALSGGPAVAGAMGELLADRDDWRNVADDAIAELVDTKAERDRLRIANDREQSSADAARAARERAWKRVREVKAERDRLRAAVDDALLAALAHYTSTYCIHDDHEHCRLTCKTCGAPCRCACHASEEATDG
jgi:cytochrome c556